MLKIIGKLNDLDGVAVSGGPDSMAILHFVRNVNKSIKAIYFNHGTSHAQEAEEFLISYCKDNQIDLICGKIQNERSSDLSLEEWWRNERYYFFDSLNIQIATGHHLNDCAETYLWSTIHGTPHVIPYRRKLVVRPFLLTPKSSLLEWCERSKVQYLIDPSNNDVRFTRNFIRHNVMPGILKVNPGFLKVVARKVKNSEPDVNKLEL